MKFVHIFGCLSAVLAALTTGCAGQKSQEATVNPAVSQAIDSARAAIKNAEANHWVWRDTEKFVQEAELAAQRGEDVVAIKLANKARAQADLAVNQYYLETSRFMLQKAQSRAGPGTAQKRTLEEAAEAVRRAEGRKAYDLLIELQ